MQNTRVVELPDPDPVCRIFYPEFPRRFLGCVYRDYVGGVCWIFIYAGDPVPGVLAHERDEHCKKGRNHA